MRCTISGRRFGFTLLELVSVVALLSLLGVMAIAGVRRSMETGAHSRVLRDLGDIDAAKLVWRECYPDSGFPSDEASRWTAIRGLLSVTPGTPGVPVTGTSSQTLSDGRSYAVYGSTASPFAPTGYRYSVGSLTEEAKAAFGATPVNRPLN